MIDDARVNGPHGKEQIQRSRILAALVLFSVSFAFAEAAVVVYLRVLYEPIHHRIHPTQSSDDLFPLLTLDQLTGAEPRALHWVTIELMREYATLLMMAAVAAGIARNLRQWFAGFMIVFGLWDVGFYGFLKVLIDWPRSLEEWDLLFLLPAPWVGPVWAPMLVALTMIGAGLLISHHEADGRNPLFFGELQIMSIIGGALLIVTAFCWDWRNSAAGRAPQPFFWQLFAIGELIVIAAFCDAWRRRKQVRYCSNALISTESDKKSSRIH